MDVIKRQPYLWDFTTITTNEKGSTIRIKYGESIYDAKYDASRLNKEIESLGLTSAPEFNIAPSTVDWNNTRTYAVIKDVAQTIARVSNIKRFSLVREEELIDLRSVKLQVLGFVCIPC